MWYENTKNLVKNTLIKSVARKYEISMKQVPIIVKKTLRMQSKEEKCEATEMNYKKSMTVIIKSVKNSRKASRKKRAKRLKKRSTKPKNPTKIQSKAIKPPKNKSKKKPPIKSCPKKNLKKDKSKRKVSKKTNNKNQELKANSANLKETKCCKKEIRTSEIK